MILTNYLYKKNLIKNLNLNFFIFNFKLNQFFTNIVYLKNKFFFSFKMLLKFLKIKNKKNYDLFLINFLKKKIKIVKNVFIFLKIKGIKKKYLLLSKLIKVFFLKNQKNILLNWQTHIKFSCFFKKIKSIKKRLKKKLIINERSNVFY